MVNFAMKTWLMRRYIYLILVVLTFRPGITATAQNSFSFDSVAPVSFITDFNDSISFTGELLYYNDTLGVPIPYVGNVHFYMLSDSMINAGQPPVVFDSLVNASVPAGGLLVSLTMGIDTAYFRSGPNVIIVWPGYNDVLARDSTQIAVEVTGYLGLDNSAGHGVILYPNPAAQQICIAGLTDFPVRIRITTLSGTVVHEQMISNNIPVPVEQLPPGMYIAQLLLPDGAVKKFRLIKR